MTYFIERDKEEIDKLLDATAEMTTEGMTKYRGMTYEQGIENAIMWLIGDWDDHPYDE